MSEVGGKAVFGSFDGGVVFKLACAPGVHAKALSLSGSVLFDASGKDRPMKDWVVVTAEHEARADVIGSPCCGESPPHRGHLVLAPVALTAKTCHEHAKAHGKRLSSDRLAG